MVIINTDGVDSVSLDAIRAYEAETKDVEGREYLYMSEASLCTFINQNTNDKVITKNTNKLLEGI